MSGDSWHRLLNGLTACGGFLLAAALLWLFAVLSSWFGDCPGGLKLGADSKGILAWPPAVQCYDHSGDLYYWQAQPWVKPVIVALLGCAFVLLVVSIVAAIRGRPADVNGKRALPPAVPRS